MTKLKISKDPGERRAAGRCVVNTSMRVTTMSIKFSTNCDGCGRMFRFESNDLADLDASRWPTKCDKCRAPKDGAK